MSGALSGLFGGSLEVKKPEDPVPGGEKKDRENAANVKPAAPPPRPTLKKFPVKAFLSQ